MNLFGTNRLTPLLLLHSGDSLMSQRPQIALIFHFYLSIYIYMVDYSEMAVLTQVR